MNFIHWLVAGGSIGWVASWIIVTHDRRRILGSIAAGMAGACLGGMLLDVLLGWSTVDAGDLGVAGLAVPLLCAGVLLAFLRLVRDAGAR